MFHRHSISMKVIAILALLCLLALLGACSKKEIKAYYSQKSNYVEASGIVTHMEYNEDQSILYLGFSNLSTQFDDNAFKIVAGNLTIVRQNSIDDKIKIGDQVDFITAPKYFGDGYVMPIVQISVDGDELLSFDQGVANLLTWLDD